MSAKAEVAEGARTATRPETPLPALLRWVSILYLSSGFPFGLVNYLLPVYMRMGGVGLDAIGKMVSDAGAAWTFKFAWSPLVDRYGTRRAWILPCQIALGVVTAALAVVDPTRAAGYFFALLVLLAVISATQDIAIDAYTIELVGERQLGAANGVRVTAYRVALLATSAVLVALVADIGWRTVFIVAGVAMLVLAALTLTIPATPRHDVKREPVLAPLKALLARPHIVATLLFALTFKLGDLAMQPMTGPFAVDRGLGPRELGLLGALAIGSVIVGALLGGALTTKWGVFRALWILGLVQALSNLGYAAAASSGAPKWMVFGAAMVEQFTGGLGTAAFLAFLMSLCDRRFAATQYAFLSALYGGSRWVAGRYSGAMVESMGYQQFFLLTFLLALPAYLLLPTLSRVRPPTEAEG